MKTSKLICLFAVLAAWLAVPFISFAGNGSSHGGDDQFISECEVDADCDEGFICLLFGVINCDEPCNTDCDEPVTEVEECEIIEFGQCVEDWYYDSECETDSDCPEGEYCILFDEYICNLVTFPCDDDEDCDYFEPECEIITVGFCMEDWYYDFECETDSDCPEGEYCLMFEETFCGGVITSCDPDGEDCPDSPHEYECETYTYGFCMPDWFVECESSSECGTDLECVTFEETFCDYDYGPAPECIVGEDCVEPSNFDNECETITYSFCLPPYIAPCTEDSDCGEGFECITEELCYCGGSSTDPSGQDFDSEPDCVCESGDYSWCQLVEQSCDDNSECPEGWTCENVYHYGPSVPVTCEVTEDGEIDCNQEPGQEDEITEMICIPPYWMDMHGPVDGSNQEPVIDYDDERNQEVGADENGDTSKMVDGAEDAMSLVSCNSSPSQAGNPAAAALILLALVMASQRRRVFLR